MTLGESIKKHRIQSQLTQKDLADQLCVSYQTISKWETGVNEPDVSTLRKMSELFQCTLDDLINPKEEETSKSEESPVEEEKPLPETFKEETAAVVPLIDNKEEKNSAEEETKTESEPEPVMVSKCADCLKPLYLQDTIHHMTRETSPGMVENVDICDECFQKHEEINRKHAKIVDSLNKVKKEMMNRDFFTICEEKPKKVLIWSLVFGIAIFAITLTVCIMKYATVGLGWTIGLPLLLGYGIMADVYCIFRGSFICDMFLSIASWSVKLPGVIFTFDLDGLAFLIVMKIVLAILGAMIGIATFLLALFLSAFIAMFCFIPMLIRDLANERG